MLCIFLALLVVPAYSDTCDSLGQYLTILDQLIGDETTNQAVDAHPSASRADPSLNICSGDDTCCTPHSEEMMRGASTEIFHTHSISMAMSTIEDELRDIRRSALSEVLSVPQAADGTVSGEAARQYVVEENIEVDTVARYRLTHFISTVYGASWESSCLDQLEETRSLMSERVFTVLNQYKKVLSGLLEGVNKIPALKVLAISELSASCTQALMRTSMFEGLGCKKCADATSTVKTCYNTCTNVARGCLRPLLCHTADWATWSKRQDILTEELHDLSSKRSAFIDALMERFEIEYTAAVRENNWDATDCNIDLDARSATRTAELKGADITLPAVQLDVFMSQFSGRLIALPEDACSQSSFVSDIQYEADGDCWNGAEVGPYVHPTPQYTLEDQKCNPEVAPVELTCDSSDMTCAGYNIATTEPPQVVTDPQFVKDKSAGTRLLASSLLIAMIIARLF